MSPGDVLLAYSDGAVEALSASGEFFGARRLAETLASCEGEPDAVVQRVMEALEEFTRGRAAYDDVTLVAVGCFPPEEEGAS